MDLPPAAGAADRPSRSRPSLLLRAGSAALARLCRPVLRPLGGGGHRRPFSRRRKRGRRRRRRPRLRRAGAQGRRPRPCSRERQAGLARAALRRAPRRAARQDRRLPEGARPAAVRLLGARPRPGPRRQAVAAAAARIPGARQRLRPLPVPRHQAAADLEVTFAHEYCHILQMGYDAYQDAWMAESTAVWMEDQVYNGINDYLRYVRRWVHLDRTPLTANSIGEYGATVWNEWLVRQYGRDIVRDAWARALHTRPGGFSVAAYDSAIRAAGSSDFSHDFARFARDVAEWRTGARFREGAQLPRRAARRQPAARRPAAASARSTTPPSSCSECTRAGGGPSSRGRKRPRGRRRPGAGRQDRRRARRPRCLQAALQAAGRRDDRAAGRPGALPADHRGA